MRTQPEDSSAPDSDGDSLSDIDESVRFLTDPLTSDTDNDGFSDADEIFVHGTDPHDGDSRPVQ